jgi:site-specific recombinase XerC
MKRVTKPRTKEKTLPTINREQLQILLKHCCGERDEALVRLLWYSGMKLSEAIDVEAHDFNLSGGTITALGKGHKYRKALAATAL